MHALFKYYAILALLLANLQLSHAAELKFKTFNTKDGLNNSTVYDIYKDSNGLIWIGTTRGVSLFTGNDFIPLDQFVSDSTYNTFTTANVINELKNNEIWVGTWGAGIYAVNIVTGDYKHYYTNPKDLTESVSNNYINCLYNNHSDELWIGTAYGLNVTTGDGHFEQFLFEETLTKGLPDIQAIIPKYDQLIAIFTLNGEIIELNTQTGSYKKVGDLNLGDKEVSMVHIDANNNFWIGTKYNGIILLDSQYNSLPLSSSFQTLKENIIVDIQSNSKGDIYIASDGKGLYKISPQTQEPTIIKHTLYDPYSLTSNQLECILIDDDEMLWVGYFKDGFSKAVLKDDGIKHYYKNHQHDSKLPSKIVNCFAEDQDGYIWIGTELGLTVFDRKAENYEPAKRKYSKAIKTIGPRPITALHFSPGENTIYVGTYNKGMYSIDLNTMKVTNYNIDNSLLKSNFIRYIYEEKEGEFYIATIHGGIYLFNNQKFTPLHIYHEEGYELLDFFHITSDQHNLWVSNAGGGTLKVKKQSSLGEMYKALNLRLSYSSVFDSDSNLYVATDIGIFAYDQTSNQFKNLNLLDEPNDFFGIIEDDNGLLWLSSSAGLFRYNPVENKLQSLTSINIQGSDFQTGSYLKLSDGTLLFGGNNGFNMIDPSKYSKSTTTNEIFISSLKIANTLIKAGTQYNNNSNLEKQINYVDELTIPFNVSLFSLRANVINYQNNEQNKIAYSLRTDTDSAKLTISDINLSFHNLPAGIYNLVIYPVDHDNIPQIQSRKTLKIIKERPWWEQPWFVLVFVLLVTLIITSQYRIRIRKLRKNKQQLELMVAEKTKDLEIKTQEIAKQRDELKETLNANKKLEGFKESLISMIIHDLKNPLNSIIGLSSLNDPLFLKNIFNASNQMLHLVENILDVRKYEKYSLKLLTKTTDLRKLSNEAIDEVGYLLEAKNNQIVNNICNVSIQVDSDIIKRVFVNLLTNAIKFSPKNGMVTIDCKESSEGQVISISDQGNGIPPNMYDIVFDLYKQADVIKSGKVNSTGIGLSFCKMAIEEHGGKIWVDTSYMNGAKIDFILV